MTLNRFLIALNRFLIDLNWLFQAETFHFERLQTLLVHLQGSASVCVQNAQRFGRRTDARDRSARLRSHSRRQPVAGQIRHPPRSPRSRRHVGNVDPLWFGIHFITIHHRFSFLFFFIFFLIFLHFYEYFNMNIIFSNSFLIHI